jgi:hypothetical protein
MSNEELIRFMVKTIKTTDKLLKICEQLFTRVLPPVMPTMEIVDKDNMTFIIVKFERNNQKKIGSKESIFQSLKSTYS